MPTKRAPPNRRSGLRASITGRSTEPSTEVSKQVVLNRGALVGPLLDEMRDQDPEGIVTVVQKFGSFPGRGSMRAREWISSLEEVATLESKGFLTMDAAAQLLSEAYPQARALKLIAELAAASIGTPPNARRLVRDASLFPLSTSAIAREDADFVNVTEVDEWLASSGVPFRISPLCKATSPADANQRGEAATPADDQHLYETTEQRRVRRYARFHELGGKLRRVSDKWQTDPGGRYGALADLQREEEAANRTSPQKKELMKDLNVVAHRLYRESLSA